jgi:hypothetical protein
VRDPILPTPFRPLPAFRVLNTLAVASAMMAPTGLMLEYLFASPVSQPPTSGRAVLSSVVVGLLWARLLRSQRRVTRWNIQIGWAMSPVFAVLNGALIGPVLFARAPVHTFAEKLVLTLRGCLAGAIFSPVVSLPALLVALVCSGYPIARAERLSARGLAGEEQGERAVGLIAAGLGVLSTLSLRGLFHLPADLRLLLEGFSLLAFLTGTCAALLSTVRAGRRRAFVAHAEAGRVPGYRVETAPEGKVLVRVETSGDVYRGSEHFEAVVELDHNGETKRSLVP